MKKLVLFALLGLLTTSALAETFRVNPSKAPRLQSILDRLQPGDVVIFERGTYRTDQALRLQDLQQVELRGEAGVEIVLSNLDQDVIAVDGCNRVVISGLSARHAQPAGEYQCEGAVIRVYRSEKVAVTDCTLNGCGAAGVYAMDSKELAVLRNTIFNNTFAAVWVYESEGMVHGNKMYRNAADLVTGGNCSVTLTGNKIENNDGKEHWGSDFIQQMMDRR